MARKIITLELTEGEVLRITSLLESSAAENNDAYARLLIEEINSQIGDDGCQT